MFWRIVFEIGKAIVKSAIAPPPIRMKMHFKWNAGEMRKWDTNFEEAQRWLDSEVLRDCEPLTPLRTGMLVKSGILGTEIGSGTVQWIAPYAKHQYYSARKAGSETGTERGPFWFERGKEKHKKYWIAGARKIACKGKK